MSPKAFITGATGFIGRVVTEFAVKEGYTVRRLSRREEGDTLLRSLGATPVRGDLNNAALLAEESKDADIVFHLAYDHDFSKPSNKALIVTNGTVGIQADPNGGETDESSPREEHPFLNRYVAENHALSFAEKGIRVVSIRLPQYVYGRGTTTGFAAQLIKLAIKSGESVYIGDGEYCFSDVYVDDAARLYLAAAKHAKAGDVFNGTGHTTTSYKALATAIGDAVQVPVRSISKEDAAARWGQFLAGFISITDRSSNRKAVEQFGWKPEGPGLLWEICSGSYVAVAKQFKADVVAS